MTETDLQAVYRLQKRIKEIKEELELDKIALAAAVSRIRASGKLEEGDLALMNKPRLFWKLDASIIDRKYPLIIPEIEKKIQDDADKAIKNLRDDLPIGLVKEALKQYGVVDKFGSGDLTGLGTQEPKDNWVAVMV